MKQGAAVNVTPQDLVRYTYQTSFGSASSLISDGNYVVVSYDQVWPFAVTNLQPNTTYYISAFEYNGSAAPAYLTTAPGTISFTTPDVPGATTPTTASSNPKTTNVDGNKMTFQWTNGNGEKRVVVMRKDNAVDFVPASATAYTANASFGSGTDLGGGQYIVYNSNGSSVDLTNLLPSATYHFAVYEYNGTGTTLRYLTSSRLTANATTATAPSSPVSAVNTATGNGQLTLSWVNGNGSGRLVVLKEGSEVNGTPVDLSVYPAAAIFKNGTQLAAGEYVVFAGAGSSVTVTNLQNKTYHYRIFEYNGSAAPVYNTANAVSGSAVLSSTLPVKLQSFTAKKTAEGVVLDWTTAQEINSAAFVVERSEDGVQYNAVATLSAAGNSNTAKLYTYTDHALVAGKIFYRLKQVDSDDKATYSAVVTVTFENQKGQIGIYPNPLTDRFRVALPQGVKEGVLSLFDSKGVQVMQQNITDEQTVSSSRLHSGIYFIRVDSKGKVYKTTVMKQ